MEKGIKHTLTATFLSLLAACGGGSGGSTAQTDGDNAAAVLAQKIRNGAAVVGAATVINGTNN